MRHVVLGVTALSLPVLGALALASDDVIWEASFTTGWWGVLLLLLTLVLGPIRVIRGQPTPVSFDLRRDVGIWAAVVALAHSALGLFVHFRGRPWTYFVWPQERDAFIPMRYDLFGAASWTGLMGTVLIVVLGAVSNDVWLRRLGVGRWKSLQRMNYVLFGVVAVHGILFQLLEKRTLNLKVVLAGLVVTVVAIQLYGLYLRRRARRSAPRD